MRFCQLTMKDDVILGDFVIEHIQTADGVVPMFVGIVDGEAAPAPDLSKLSPAQRERARQYAGRKPDGKRVAIPVGAVVWAEVADGGEDVNDRASIEAGRELMAEYGNWPPDNT